jgi:DNA-binding SARP family transcriptional activator
MELSLLGPVEAWAGGHALDLGTPQRRAVLAALAVDAGRPVTLATLTSRVWDDTPPVGARPALYAHIARLRAALEAAARANQVDGTDQSNGLDPSGGPERARGVERAGGFERTGRVERVGGLVRRGGGYALDVPPEWVDVALFRQLVATAREPGRTDADRIGLLARALALWRGTPLADVPGQWAARMRDSWEWQRLDAVVQWSGAQIRLGRAEEVIDPVRDLLADHPRAEALVEVLMRGYAAVGRQGEALEAYASTRARLVAELGVEPGPALREAHAAVLRGGLGPAAAVGPRRPETAAHGPAALAAAPSGPGPDGAAPSGPGPDAAAPSGPAAQETAPYGPAVHGSAAQEAATHGSAAGEPAVRGPAPTGAVRLTSGRRGSARRGGPARARRGRRSVAPPAQLPAAVAGFTGRDGELRELDRLLGEAEVDSAGAGVLITVSGAAGVGKTALALRWAQRGRHRWPDGQLYLDLRGCDPDPPVEPADALARLLAGLGVPTSDIPADAADRAARYRTETSGRRMLALLDNAASTDQVRPLLPGAMSGAVLVTSRDTLPGLVARHGARRLDLDRLPSTDAVPLLRALIGDRVAAEPEAASALAEQCARLPLALRIAAEVAISQPTRPLRALVDDLTDPARRLDLLDAGGDARTGLRAVFGWSYRRLDPDQAEAFRRLGAHPGPFELATAQRLIRTDGGQARALLDALTRAHLVEPVPPYWQLHDLLRAYAAELS